MLVVVSTSSRGESRQHGASVHGGGLGISTAATSHVNGVVTTARPRDHRGMSVEAKYQRVGRQGGDDLSPSLGVSKVSGTTLSRRRHRDGLPGQAYLGRPFSDAAGIGCWWR